MLYRRRIWIDQENATEAGHWGWEYKWVPLSGAMDTYGLEQQGWIPVR